MRVIVTGASGVLGTAVYDAFKASPQNEVLGLAHSRPRGDLKVLDLMDNAQVEKVFAEFKPDWVIHCAAERRPDVAEKNPEAAQKLNADVPANLAALAKSLKFTLVYISTDYVFDGTHPPYPPSATTNPLNFYGRSKRDGELAVLGVTGAKSIVLRVPVLYGPAPKNSDTAVNILIDVVTDQSGKTYTMDHYATRYPTNVLDIADFLVRLSTLPPARLPPVLHYSAAEPFTKYEMCLVFAQILGLPHTHIVPDAEPYTGAAATTRPRDCQLYTGETEELLAGAGGLGWTPFAEWWTGHLQRKQ
ncbi:SDR family oxidoreductase [Phanerochaete sordida]|uniref:SDR family oxidoreductase n=1 Tax=Phanerochaete sordida TaxID=48140 RepID=A0A9P3GID7_9APHY|nr:SDR family oxidoreductase [Phanerochaete sordida]